MARHPDFVRFSTAFREARQDDALSLLKGLAALYADAVELNSHRANCFEQLQRDDDVKAELERLLSHQPDSVED
jgi:hypothetical protein